MQSARTTELYQEFENMCSRQARRTKARKQAVEEEKQAIKRGEGMTNEEALESILTYCSEECGEIDACDFEVFNKCTEAVAIKAIRKQIPANVIDIRAFTLLVVGNCPTCGCMVIDEVYYCENCGQALKWEVKE